MPCYLPYIRNTAAVLMTTHKPKHKLNSKKSFEFTIFSKPVVGIKPIPVG
jgi:hypothetical protein